MESYKKLPTRNWAPDYEQPSEAENKFVEVEDTRKLVEDTTKYPFKAVAFVESEYFSDDIELAGTGFLCENNLFMTVAHNVRDDDRKAAKIVKITFGLDGEEDYSKKKQILLEGCDFTVPKKYKKKTDDCDIAWVDLQEYYRQKVEEGYPLEWDLSDLPNEFFFSCSIPYEDGKLNRDFSLCGKNINSLIDIKVKINRIIQSIRFSPES